MFMNQFRKKFFIHQHFQSWFLRYTIGIVVVLSAVYYGAIHLFFFLLRKKSEDMGFQPSNIFVTFLDQQETQMNLIFGMTLLIAISFITSYGLIQSNKVAGPIIRLKKYLEEWQANAQPSELVFRKGDFFKEIADSINRCLESTERKK